VSLLKERLHAATAPDPQRVARLISQLDSEQFTAREEAMQALEQLAELATPALRQALKDRPAAEVRRRLERLLEKLEPPLTVPELLRQLRALEVLEHIATPEARQLLQTVAKGVPEARLTQQAKASLERLATHAAARP
jgi:hypothetical protein